MLYFKNVELAKKYRVSLGTVRNWIEAAQSDKLDLSLVEDSGRTYIANTAKNTALMTQVTSDHRKYRNKNAVKKISPQAEFYSLYSEEQIFDIINTIEIHREVPRQYNYFGVGASRWQAFAQRLAEEESLNMLTGTLKLLESNKGYIDNLLVDYKRINVIDIGVGNARPVKGLLEQLRSTGKLQRYIALDISPTMLELAESNIKEWFGGAIDFESHLFDVNYDRFSRFLTDEYMRDDAKDAINIVVLFGGTMSNMRYPDNGYRMIHDSMGINDVLLHANKLDTETHQKYFFDAKPGNLSLSPNHRLVFDLLNIDEKYYDVEMGYDPNTHQRYIRAQLKVAVDIEFVYRGGKRVVTLDKNDTLLVWRFIHQTARGIAKQFEENDFYTFHSSQTADDEYILTISRVRKEHPASKFLSITDTYSPR